MGTALLRQLLLLDVEYAHRAGETPRPGDYQTRLPHDSGLIEDICAAARPTSPPGGWRAL